MTASRVNEGGGGARSGAHVLTLLSAPLRALSLEALSDGPKRQAELRRQVSFAAQTTVRGHLKGLEEIGAISKRHRDAFPGVVEYELEKSGRELLLVIGALKHWLAGAPEGPLELGAAAGKVAIKTLVDAWSSTMLHALAARPLSLTQLDQLIALFNYPSLERRFAALRLARLIEATSASRNGTPYAVTDWLRRGIGPIVAASRWERRHLPTKTPEIARIDAETALLLSVPLLKPPLQAYGSCRLVVEAASGSSESPAAITARAADGRIASYSLGSTEADAWAVGRPSAWFRAAIEVDSDHLELGGDSRLARTLVDGLRDGFLRCP